MALHHLLYRCPRCGHDPTRGERDRAVCEGCGRSFVRVREGRRIHIHGPAGGVERALVQTLVGDIERLGGSVATARGPDGHVRHSAEAILRRSLLEEPVVHEGRLLGYIERMGEPLHGVVTIDEAHIRFDSGEGRQGWEWNLLDLRAVQTSSSALQISPGDGSIVQFKFVHDSPFRWEDLLRTLLTEAWLREGRGRIVEFQPRIVAA